MDEPIKAVVFTGEYDKVLPGLGTYKAGQVIDDPEKIERIIFSQYRKCFIDKEVFNKQQAEAERLRQVEENKAKAKLNEERAKGVNELKRVGKAGDK